MQQIRKPTWHFRAVAALSLLWSLALAFACTMIVARDPQYLAQLSADAVQSLDAAPTWAILAWALGHWVAALGSILLLLRSRLALAAFCAAVAGLAAATGYWAAVAMTGSLLGALPTLMILLVWAGVLLFLAYALRARRAGLLR